MEAPPQPPDHALQGGVRQLAAARPRGSSCLRSASVASAVRPALPSTKASRAKAGSFVGVPAEPDAGGQHRDRGRPPGPTIRPALIEPPQTLRKRRSVTPEPIAETSTAAPKRIATSAGKEGAVVLRREEGEAVAQRVDDGDLAQPQDQYGDQAAREADHHALDHERPADEPAGGADQPHHLDLAAAGVDREPDRVADQHQRGDDQQRRDHGEDDLQGPGDLLDLLRFPAGGRRFLR